MNREQIIQMARDAGMAVGFGAHEDDEVACFSLALLERFAAAILAATKEEDAKICEEYVGPLAPALHCAVAIRASK